MCKFTKLLQQPYKFTLSLFILHLIFILSLHINNDKIDNKEEDSKIDIVKIN